MVEKSRRQKSENQPQTSSEHDFLQKIGYGAERDSLCARDKYSTLSRELALLEMHQKKGKKKITAPSFQRYILQILFSILLFSVKNNI